MYTSPSTWAVALPDKIITVSSHRCVCSGMAAPGENVATPAVMLVAPFCSLTEHALQLSSFSFPLAVHSTRLWQFGHRTSKRDAESGGAKVYVTFSGKSYRRKDCRFVDKRASAVPLLYTQRYYEPCAACEPPAHHILTRRCPCQAPYLHFYRRSSTPPAVNK